MDIASAIAGWVGAIAGVAALVWQAFTWRRSAHRVKVERSSSVLVGGWQEDDNTYLCVTARNVGAAPVTVTGWGVEFGRKQGGMIVPSPPPQSATLPYKLDAGESINLLGRADAFRESAQERGVSPKRLTAYVTLGTGATVRAPRGCPI